MIRKCYTAVGRSVGGRRVPDDIAVIDSVIIGVLDLTSDEPKPRQAAASVDIQRATHEHTATSRFSVCTDVNKSVYKRQLKFINVECYGTTMPLALLIE